MKVLGMGNALVDVLAKIGDDNLLDALGLYKGAMTLIDENKFRELSLKLGQMEKAIVSGGSASNTIVGLASLGISTGFIGRVGNDVYGELYKKDLEKYNVTPHLIEADEASGIASTFVSTDGERTFGTYLGAAALLKASDLEVGFFQGYDYFYIEGYLVQSHSLILQGVKLAKQAGLKVVIDLASFNVVEENIDFLMDIIPQYVDIVFANEDEAKALTGLSAEQAVSKLAAMSGLAIVKTGAAGSWVQHGQTKLQVPTQKIESLDTTGAGDLYAAGFIYGLTKQKDLGTCARIGNLLAGEVIKVMGPKVPENKWAYIKQEMSKL